ncbi:MAG: hypothetical protein ACC641_09915 [Acidiferrobacterales bacterium]
MNPGQPAARGSAAIFSSLQQLKIKKNEHWFAAFFVSEKFHG